MNLVETKLRCDGNETVVERTSRVASDLLYPRWNKKEPAENESTASNMIGLSRSDAMDFFVDQITDHRWNVPLKSVALNSTRTVDLRKSLHPNIRISMIGKRLGVIQKEIQTRGRYGKCVAKGSLSYCMGLRLIPVRS